jgi:Tfp pilus assembly protein PilV
MSLQGGGQMLCKEAGSTLVEVIIAMLILSMLVVGLNMGVVTLVKSNLNSRDLTAATTAGNQRFEEMRRGDYDTLRTDLDTVRNRYVLSWTIGGDFNVNKEVTLTVYWPLELRNHHIQLSTIIARP